MLVHIMSTVNTVNSSFVSSRSTASCTGGTATDTELELLGRSATELVLLFAATA